jgi:hypothetical protein
MSALSITGNSTGNSTGNCNEPIALHSGARRYWSCLLAAVLLVGGICAPSYALGQAVSEALAEGEVAADAVQVVAEGEYSDASESSETNQVDQASPATDDVASSTPESEDAEAEARRAAEEAARLARLSAEKSALEERLIELQYEHGIYSPVLMESYSDLGALHIELGDYTAAADSYNQALQIARINDGLYSEQQLPLLLALIDTQQLREDWQRADDAAHLYMHLHERLYDLRDPLLLAAAEDFGKWRLRLINENLLDLNTRERMDLADELSGFYERLLNPPEPRSDALQGEIGEGLAESDQQLSAEWELSFLESKAQADLTLARAVASLPNSYFAPPEPRYIYQTRCRTTVNTQGQSVRECYQVRVENPRFNRSQGDAKRAAMGRYTREVQRNLDRMTVLQESADSLTESERTELIARIDTMRSSVREIDRLATRSLLNFR